ncbi:uncharacterized protein LOC143361943 [Halictus rubicundus]|uniref:uncharacterized protein LOC143361943 n=1 Tax=Halictus rubicundus TaxID=77578 RepID=UPI004036B3FE
MSHNTQIDKLTKDNYDTWKEQMEAILTKNDLWCYVDGWKPKPAERENNADQIANWVRNDKKAKADIVLSLSASEICHVKNLQTSSDAWTALERVYASKGPAKRATLLKKLLFTRLTEDGSMADHLNKLFDIIDKLQQMDIPIANDLLTIVILYSMPRSYEGFRCAIESRDTLPDPYALKIKILEEAEARSRLNEEDTHDALYVRQGNPHRPKYTNSKTNKEEMAVKYKSNDSTSTHKPYKCTFCKKPGHKADDCWKKKSNRQHQASYCEKDYEAIMTHGDCQNALALSALSAIITHKDVWCLDSGAMSHMCNNKSLFSELNTEAEKGTLKVALTNDNNMSLETEAEEADGNIHEDEESHDSNEDSGHSLNENRSNSGFRRGHGRPKIIRTGNRGAPKKHYNLVPIQHQANMIHEEYPTLKEALKGPNSNDWKSAMEKEYDAFKSAMEKEYDAFKSAGAWIEVEKPTNKNVIGCKWVLRTKLRSDGTIERRKARLVAKGFAQQPGIDFMETYAPVARMGTIRIVMALAAEWNLSLFQLDVEMAYINGDLEEEIHMEQPELGKVLLLKKALYGLKQSGRQWFQKLDSKLKSFGLRAINADKCLYFRKCEQNVLIVVVYVDDIIIATNQLSAFNQLKKELSTDFRTKDLGPLSYCLGIEFKRNNKSGELYMLQKKYITGILQRFGMMDAKPVQTPLEPKIKLSQEMRPKTDDERSKMKSVPYRSLVGSLMYAAVSTRPDIAYAVSMLSRFNEDPGGEHWTAGKRVLRYLKATISHGITYKKTGCDFHGFVDSDWGSNMDDRKSQTGYIFRLADAPITWESRRQRCVALSSVEAEYMALTEAIKEAVYLRSLLSELGMSEVDHGGTIVYCDNQGAQKLIKNPVFHSRTKHIDIRYHYIRCIPCMFNSSGDVTMPCCKPFVTVNVLVALPSPSCVLLSMLLRSCGYSELGMCLKQYKHEALSEDAFCTKKTLMGEAGSSGATIVHTTDLENPPYERVPRNLGSDRHLMITLGHKRSTVDIWETICTPNGSGWLLRPEFADGKRYTATRESDLPIISNRSISIQLGGEFGAGFSLSAFFIPSAVLGIFVTISAF